MSDWGVGADALGGGAWDWIACEVVELGQREGVCIWRVWDMGNDVMIGEHGVHGCEKQQMR